MKRRGKHFRKVLRWPLFTILGWTLCKATEKNKTWLPPDFVGWMESTGQVKWAKPREIWASHFESARLEEACLSLSLHVEWKLSASGSPICAIVQCTLPALRYYCFQFQNAILLCKHRSPCVAQGLYLCGLHPFYKAQVHGRRFVSEDWRGLLHYRVYNDSKAMSQAPDCWPGNSPNAVMLRRLPSLCSRIHSGQWTLRSLRGSHPFPIFAQGAQEAPLSQ